MFKELKNAFEKIVTEKGLLDSEVKVLAKQLTSKEAIGETERKDFPLLQGKESLMQAEFKGDLGQAFTDMPMHFTGTLKDILALPLQTNGERALFISTLNAVMRHLGMVDRTIHCKNKEPELCSAEIAKTVIENYGSECKIGIIGYQPAIIDHFSQIIPPDNIRVTDLDKENIGQKKYGVTVWDGMVMGDEIFNSSDVLLATGSTIVNDSMKGLLQLSDKYRKPIFFFGTSAAGPAVLLNLQRLCFKAT